MTVDAAIDFPAMPLNRLKPAGLSIRRRGPLPAEPIPGLRPCRRNFSQKLFKSPIYQMASQTGIFKVRDRDRKLYDYRTQSVKARVEQGQFAELLKMARQQAGMVNHGQNNDAFPPHPQIAAAAPNQLGSLEFSAGRTRASRKAKGLAPARKPPLRGIARK